MTKVVKIGNVMIGGGNPVAVQSMTNTDTKDIPSTVEQIEKLQKAGCQIVRLSVYDSECVDALKKIKSRVSVPLVADIHFDYKLAIGSILAGADKIRINPGNIGAKWKVEEVARVAMTHGVPIRVGSNEGSMDESYIKKFKSKVEALVYSALDEVNVLESVGFKDIVVAVKSSDPVETIQANEMISKMTQYPLHIGVTEAGIYEDAIVRSAFALGHLLYEGIGDTIRVSIAGDPVREVGAAYSILQSVKRFEGPEIIACPTCARTEINVEELAAEVRSELINVKGKVKVAVMGCVVNGIGEAKGADVAVFGTKSGGVIYFHGKIISTVNRDEILPTLKKLVEDHLKGEKDEINKNG
ncbi:flavodoxin-dependent (E)-4-hydroxy-3-methylbut-2-enyl-diphosphate synthase [Athalassotoga saccharophila]|uniref:flavodoxin-dependent (E)-4-hydroxy-3-methylbut-2-enyl-diphosphate synthase n=1 Tax=Athalassotoga saccharophila TaxID=1441386 RepID=UPI00137A415C|nr:flavodoxin-dependent (E)-4-hydroxy-3-methylbut-2-enyl-diphosphate synthase [Athalassotoga saccharophila]BBJ28999.1 4-hydroxy-3-methylbut-2-en-1-yl diphosphate synthase (flavodoxin) [Athalassotoga saccharophila]